MSSSPWAASMTLAALAGAATLQAQSAPAPRTFYVDAADGNDGRDGLSAGSAWRTLGKINAAPLRPGDTLRLRRGGTWRGQLVPHSGQPGAPVTYAAYGHGEKPLLLGSASRSAADDWTDEGGNVWATVPLAYTPGRVQLDLGRAAWSFHREGGAAATLAKTGGAPGEPVILRIDCRSAGVRGNHIQLSVAPLAVRDGRYYAFRFRARCTKPFAVPAIALMKRNRPWTSYGSAISGGVRIGRDFADYVVRFTARKLADDGRITLYLGGGLPAGASFFFQPGAWHAVRCNQAEPLDVDVGNIIFDHGASTGVKKWRPEDLRAPGDYWYAPATCQVKLYSRGNPAGRHRSIELALRRHIIDQGGRGHVTYEGLALRYGAAHGIGGGDTHHVVVRDCDLSYIGGGHQSTRPDGVPVRYGNAIEFWADAHDHLVERCRIWEVYDAALTNQGSGVNVQRNITYRHNVIWNCEYSFEYWNRGGRSRTENIHFVHNTCAHAGAGWGHAQRPDRNGRHVMFYSNTARTTNFHVRGNIFFAATESLLRLGRPDWSDALTMDHNCWFQPTGPLIQWLDRSFTPKEFAEYRRATGQDAHSIVADPQFADAANADFRLAPDSPARRLGGKSQPAGALP